MRLPRRALRKIKDQVGPRRFTAYLLLAAFVVCVPAGVFTFSTGAGLIAAGCCAFVASYLLGAE